MPRLSKLMTRCFGYASLVSAVMFIALAPVLFRSPLPNITPRFHAEPLGLLLIAMRELMLLVPPVVAIVSGMAWLALLRGLPSARHWAIAASISLLALSMPFFEAGVAIMRYHLAGNFVLGGVFFFCAIFFFIGIVGLVAYGKRNSRQDADLSLTTATGGCSGLDTLVPTM